MALLDGYPLVYCQLVWLPSNIIEYVAKLSYTELNCKYIMPGSLVLCSPHMGTHWQYTAGFPRPLQLADIIYANMWQ